MSEIDFLSVEDILAGHQDQVTRYGGKAGLRDQRLLESAAEAGKPEIAEFFRVHARPL